MRIAMVGLGRMGAGMTRRVLRAGHEVVGFDVNPASVADVVRDGALGAASLEDAIAQLAAPRVGSLMLPAGRTPQHTSAAAPPRLAGRDVIGERRTSRHPGHSPPQATVWWRRTSSALVAPISRAHARSTRSPDTSSG